MTIIMGAYCTANETLCLPSSSKVGNMRSVGLVLLADTLSLYLFAETCDEVKSADTCDEGKDLKVQYC